LAPTAIVGAISRGALDAGAHVTLANPNLDNYAQALRPEYVTAFIRSLYYALVTTVLSLAIGYTVAYWISRQGGRRKILLLILVMLPFWTSWLIRTYAWMIILRDNGILNSLLLSLGVISDPIPILTSDAAVILGMTY